MTTPHPTLVPLPSSPSSVTSGVSSPSSSRSRSAFSSPVSPLNVSTSRSRPRLSRNVTTGTTATIRLGNTTVEQQDPFYESSTVSVNQPVGSLSISPSSRDVCLASRKGLYILDLGNLNNAPRFIPQGGTWQIADCQWSPHPVTSNLILSTSSQKLLVWDLSAQKCLYRQIDAHARAITDINWHARNPNLMATVGMDAGIRGWDLRAWDKPFMRVCAWGVAGTQIKWNRQHEHIFATAHGKEVLIWDDRKGSVPVVVIKAHDAKIYGIDWDREHRHKLVTCSLDKTIKYWTVPELSSQVANADVEFYHSLPAPSTPTHTISTSYPVWRARNLPFGHGVLALPQRGQEDLDMFGYSSSSQPAQTFEGHDDVVKEFVWRSRGGEDSSCEDREFQLVTWSKDRTLRIWPVAPDILERVGYKYGAPIKVLQSRKGAPDITYTQVGKPQPSDEQPSARPLPLLPLPVVNPSGISKQKMAKLETAMTRGGGVKAKGMDQLEWLTKVVKNKASPDSSHINSRAASRTRFGSRGTSGERRTESERDKGEWISLKDEVVLVHKIFPRPKINFEKIDLAHRKLTISMNGPWANGNRMAFMRIHWSFPSTYPYTNDVPTFELERNPTVSPITRQKLIATIKEMRAANRQCLVATSAFLLGSHERVGRRLIEDDSDSESEKDVNVQLANVPMLIRTCGATFGPNGQLVCFFPKQTVLPRTRQLSRSPSVPREFQKNPLLKAMSALSRFDNPRQRNAIRIKPRLRKFENLLAPVQAGSTMTIHDVSHLGNPDLDLARSYGVSLSPERNLQKAFEHKKLHHAEIWSALIGLLSDPPPPPYSVMPPTQQDRDMGERREREAWERGVARKKLVLEQIFENLAAGHDIQLFALVACILLDHVKKTPAPPRPSPLLTHSPAQDYFALPRHQLSRPSSQTYLPSLVNTPLRKRSSLTPVSPGLIGSSYRTSGFSQVFSNSNFSRAGGSSLSLRNSGAITPTHRSSFDIQPMSSDFAMSNNDSPPVLLSPGITMPVPVRRPGASPRYRDRPYRMSSGVVIAESPSAISSLRNTTASANNSANLPGDNSAKGCDVRPTSEASRSLTAGPQAPSSGTNTSGSRVTFDSVSPFRRGLSRVSTNMSAQSGPTQAYPKDSDKRNRRVCSVRIEFDNDSIEPPSLLDHETRITCELVKLAYADFLLRSDLLGIRTALMQYNFLDPADPTIDALSAAHGTVHISAHQRQSQLHSVKQICVGCGASQEQCPSCKQAPVKPVCVYCRLPIKGIATTCVMCTHRTHAKCFKIHFGASGSPTCPSCSCTCVKNGGVTGHLLPIPQNAAGMSSPVKPEVTKGLARGNNTLPLAGGTGRMTYATLKTIRESSLGDQGDAMVGLGLSPEGTKQTHTGSSEDSSAGGSGMASGWLTWDPARLPWAGSGTGGNAGSETAGMDSEGDEAVKQAGRGKGAEGILARTRLSTAFRSSDGRARSKGR